jgi:hypothetical protein
MYERLRSLGKKVFLANLSFVKSGNHRRTTTDTRSLRSEADHDRGQPKQNGIGFPLSLAERYQPRKISDFIGLERPKQIMAGLLLAGPRPIPAPKPVEPEPAAVVIVAKSEDASAAARKAWETRRARAAARRSHR